MAEQLLGEHYAHAEAADKEEWKALAQSEHVCKVKSFQSQESAHDSTESVLCEDHSPPGHSHQPEHIRDRSKHPQPLMAEQLLGEHYAHAEAADKEEWKALAQSEHVCKVKSFQSQESAHDSTEPHPPEKNLQSHPFQSRFEKAGHPRCMIFRLPGCLIIRLPTCLISRGWLTFAPDHEDWPSRAALEAEEFLSMYLPSKVTEVNGEPVKWISASAPVGDRTGKLQELGDSDVDGLLVAWSDLQETGQPMTYPVIRELAIAHRCLSGKWLIYKDTGYHIDLTWERVFRGTVAGQLGSSAKVSSALGIRDGPHVVCMYSRDFTDREDVEDLERRIRGQGIRCRLFYKPDAMTHLGVYGRNEWGLKPYIYISNFDAGKKCSTIVSVYDE